MQKMDMKLNAINLYFWYFLCNKNDKNWYESMLDEIDMLWIDLSNNDMQSYEILCYDMKNMQLKLISQSFEFTSWFFQAPIMQILQIWYAMIPVE